MNRKSTTALSIASLLTVNFVILARLFKTEYTPFMSSIEGAFVGISRWLLSNWTHPGWFPIWYGGIPVQNAYPPLLHWLVAFASMVTGMSVVHSHHFVTALFYCVAPAGLFCLTIRLSRSISKAFVASLIYSLVSPSAFLIPSVRHDMGTVWGARKIHALIYYAGGPHDTSIALLFFALAALDAALEYELGAWTVLAIFSGAAVALTNWLGTMAFALGALALVIARRKNRFLRLALIGALTYAVAMPWIPPSNMAAIQRNAQMVGEFPMGHAQYLYLAVWVIAAFAIGFMLRKTALPDGSRFAILFLFLMAVPPLGYEYFQVYPLPQPDRYHLEMDAAVAVIAGLILCSDKLVARHPWWRAAVGAGLAGLLIMQVPRWRHQVRGLLPPFDVTTTVERAQALWMQQHFPGQRVYVEGSTRFWLNAFIDNPQLGGGFDQGRSNSVIPAVTFAIPYLKSNGSDSAALLKAFGVRAVAVGGPRSRDAYHQYNDPGKFAGVVPEVWREGDDVIYEIPGDGSLAHVVDTNSLVTTTTPTLDWPAINRFAAAIDRSRESGKISPMVWDGASRATIRTRVAGTEALSVQVSWDPGWRASVNGSDLPIEHDALGQMVLRPNCGSGCTVDLTYTGGTETFVARTVCVLAFLVCGLIFWRGRKNVPLASPRIEQPPSAPTHPFYFRAARALVRWLNLNLPEWPIAPQSAHFDSQLLQRAETALRSMKMPDADGDRYLAKHIPRLSKTLALVPPPQNTGRVLELGCYMQITPLLQRVSGYREVRGAYYGPPGKIDRKTFDFPDGQFSCYVDHFDAERHEYPYPDNYFDLVLAGEIIEHMTHDPMWMLLESRRVLADGGYLLISTPNVGSVTSAAKTLDGRDNPQIFFLYERPGPDGRTDIGHVREYTFHELGEAAKAAGFEVEKIFTTFIDEFSEHRQLLKFLALNGYNTENRGEQTWCLARKNAKLPIDRYPWFIYTP